MIAAAFMLPPMTVERTPDPDLVEAGVAVQLKTTSAGLKWVVIEDGSNVDPRWQEYNPASPMVIPLLGRRVGDVIELPGPLINDEATIVRLARAAQYAASRCMELWDQFFPEIPFIQRLTMPDLGPEPTKEELIAALRPVTATEQKRNEQSEQVLSLYRERPMTTWQFGCGLGIGQLRAADLVLATSDLTLRSIRDLKSVLEHARLLERGGQTVCDCTSFVVLATLGLLEQVLEATELLVPCRLLSECENAIRQVELDGEAPTRFAEVNGEPRIIRTDVAGLKKWVACWRAQLNLLEDKARAVPGLPLARLTADVRETLEKVVGPADARAIAIAAEQSVPLLTDDLVVADVAAQHGARARTSAFGVLQHLVSSHSLREEDADVIVARAIGCRVADAPLSTGVVVAALRAANWDLRSSPAS